MKENYPDDLCYDDEFHVKLKGGKNDWEVMYGDARIAAEGYADEYGLDEGEIVLVKDHKGKQCEYKVDYIVLEPEYIMKRVEKKPKKKKGKKK